VKHPVQSTVSCSTEEALMSACPDVAPFTQAPLACKPINLPRARSL
jgi:hypothetical protein